MHAPKPDLEPAGAPGLWPADRALIALISGDPGSAWSRFSVLGVPGVVRRCAIRSGVPVWTETPAGGPSCAVPDADPDPFAELERFTRPDGSRRPLPGWIGWISYDAGRLIEPTRLDPPPEGAVLMEWTRVEDAYIHDASDGSWAIVGDASSLPPLTADPAGFEIGELAEESRERYKRGVERTLAYIRAGDIYQANIAHELRLPFVGSARAFASALFANARPWYGVYSESPGGAIVSASPELFLEFDATSRRVITRPMKGTSARAHELERSPKDRAELAMITDLMRNDLGRVCAFGSVRVEDARTIEPHAGGAVHQGVATVSGTLRTDVGIGRLLRATFPPGSVTGAPKIRAMQIIDEIEDFRRGAWCGCMGYISDSGDVALCVAIRTATVRDGVLSYPVGAGIVADSTPESEWRETLSKASALGSVRTPETVP